MSLCIFPRSRGLQISLKRMDKELLYKHNSQHIKISPSKFNNLSRFLHQLNKNHLYKALSVRVYLNFKTRWMILRSNTYSLMQKKMQIRLYITAIISRLFLKNIMIALLHHQKTQEKNHQQYKILQSKLLQQKNKINSMISTHHLNLLIKHHLILLHTS